MNHYLYRAPCCSLRLDFDEHQQLTAISWLTEPAEWLSPLTGLWAEKLDDYFAGRLHQFDYPVSAAGTAFQQRVWQAILTIPYGQVASYGDIARQIGSHPRAVGQACGKNPLPIVVPCHRVVSAHGLGGFGLGVDDADLAIKRWLLQHEGAKWPL